MEMQLMTDDIHDALVEAPNSAEIYALILEHYQDACNSGHCSPGFNVSARCIGSIVIDAIREYERKNEQPNLKYIGEREDEIAADLADDKYNQRQES